MRILVVGSQHVKQTKYVKNNFAFVFAVTVIMNED